METCYHSATALLWYKLSSKVTFARVLHTLRTCVSVYLGAELYCMLRKLEAISWETRND